MQNCGHEVKDFRIQLRALEALREATELFMYGWFEDSYLIALHAKRVTLMPKDVHLLTTLLRQYCGIHYDKSLEQPGN